MKSLVAVALVAAACGGDKKTPDAAIHDAPPLIDAPPPTVLEVDCASVTPTGPTIITTDGQFSYMPSTDTIAVNDVKMFRMSSTHNVVPNATMSDSGLRVGFSQTKCLKFTKQGTFGFHCGPHAFQGSIVVQ